MTRVLSVNTVIYVRSRLQYDMFLFLPRSRFYRDPRNNYYSTSLVRHTFHVIVAEYTRYRCSNSAALRVVKTHAQKERNSVLQQKSDI